MSKIKIIYSKEYDIQRVKNTINKIDWFIENKYDYKKFSFPKKLDLEKIKNYSDQEIEDIVASEYEETLYKENEQFLNKQWSTIFNEIEQAFSRSSLVIQDEYNIYLTKYGTGGSYDIPNKVIINLSKSWNIGMLKTIIHEIIHLSIQKYIDEYKIGQWEKERIVDLFFIKNFPNRVPMQNMPINTKDIDEIFIEKFPDIKAVIEKISN
jgi:hypothetical protein